MPLAIAKIPTRIIKRKSFLNMYRIIQYYQILGGLMWMKLNLPEVGWWLLVQLNRSTGL